jgi:hypothetical protein
MIERRKPLKRSWIKRHAPKRLAGFDDPKYLAWIRSLKCVCCKLEDRTQLLRTEAHHAGDHGFAQRAPDSTCVPLCGMHHRLGPLSAHRLGRKFWDVWKLDRDELIAALNERYAASNLGSSQSVEAFEPDTF